MRGGAGLGEYSRSRERRKASPDNQDSELPTGANESYHLASRLTPTLIAFAILFTISVPVFAKLEGWSFIESFYFGERKWRQASCHATAPPLLPPPPLPPPPPPPPPRSPTPTPTAHTHNPPPPPPPPPLAVAQSVTTTGYGDYTPTHQVSRGVAIALVVLGLVITTVWVAQLHSISSEMGRKIVRRRLKEKGLVAKNGLEIEEMTQVRTGHVVVTFVRAADRRGGARSAGSRPRLIHGRHSRPRPRPRSTSSSNASWARSRSTSCAG